MTPKLVQMIINEIKRRSAVTAKLPYGGDLEFTVANLESEDRALLSAVLAGTNDLNGRALEMLNHLGVISVPLYVLRYEEDRERLFAICDEFMVHFSELFATLVTHAMDVNFSRFVDLHAILHDYLRLFTLDVSQSPKTLNKDAISNIFQFLSAKCRCSVGWSIIKSYTEFHPFPILEAISRQRTWDEPHSNLIKILNDSINHELVLVSLLSLVKGSNSDSLNWRHYLQVVYLAVEKLKTNHVKDFLNTCFTEAVRTKNDFHLYVMFLTARECAHLLSFGNYKTWYKTSIGEMTYKTDKEGFRYVMKVLTRMVEFESDSEILRIHQEIMIQAPTLCKDLVQLYKSLIASRLDILVGCNQIEQKMKNLPGVIEID